MWQKTIAAFLSLNLTVYCIDDSAHLIILTVNTLNVEQIIPPVAQYSGLLLTLGATRWTELHVKDVIHSISSQCCLSVAHESKEQ